MVGLPGVPSGVYKAGEGALSTLEPCGWNGDGRRLGILYAERKKAQGFERCLRCLRCL